MFRTLKSKISFVYFCLIILIAIVGSVSVLSLFNLSKSVNGIMENNYNSVNYVSKMLDELERQDSALLLYINGNKQAGIDSFSDSNNVFLQWYNKEQSNITEVGESDYVKKINDYYITYTKLFLELQEIKNNKAEDAIDFYNNTITPHFNKLKQCLRDVSDLNEKAMFKSKDVATQNVIKYTYIILFLSILAVLAGFALSRFFINRFLMPMHSLIRTIKLVKEGDLNKQTPVISRDEVGELAIEFNNMTKRLLEYDKSSIGKLLVEKNKSLAIVKSIKDPLIVLDTGYKILLMNSACESFFNVREEKAFNKHFLETIRNGELFDYISSIFESKAESKEKIIYINSNGDDFYFNVIVTLVKDIDLKLTGLVVTFHNVTQLKQLEMVKTDFISTISHEFKTPLTSIMMGATLMENASLGTLTKKQKNIINTIKEDGERLSSLVNNLLELSKIESGKSIFNIKPHSIFNIIENSMKHIHEQVKNKGVKLYFESVDDLPIVNVDHEKISWVVNNLLSNALRYTNSGDFISIRAYEKDGKVYVAVKDTGIGIPLEYLKKIFDKFVQVKGNDSEVRGTGLGLAIVKEIIEVHGGEIWCVSKPKEGSTFIFTLPLSNKEVL
jgi:PAS domain S-box-containing protein